MGSHSKSELLSLRAASTWTTTASALSSHSLHPPRRKVDGPAPATPALRTCIPSLRDNSSGKGSRQNLPNVGAAPRQTTYGRVRSTGGPRSLTALSKGQSQRA